MERRTWRGGRGLISCERCIRSEENNIGWYVRNSTEPLLEAMKSARIVNVVKCVTPEEFKKKTCGGWREILEGKENVWTIPEGAGKNRCR